MCFSIFFSGQMTPNIKGYFWVELDLEEKKIVFLSLARKIKILQY